jgi:polyisoprenoid-binding protein YceI
MNPRFLLLAPLFLLPLAWRSPQAAPAPAKGAAGAWKVDPVHTTVLFKIKHLDTSWTFGRFNGVSGTLDFDEAKPEASKLSVEIDPATVDTNQKPREDHLRGPDFFSVKEFPKISFSTSKVAKSGDGFDVSGELALHGVKKPISFKAQKVGESNNVAAGGPRIGFLAETKLKRSDFGMDKYLDTIGDEVTLTLSLELTH